MKKLLICTSITVVCLFTTKAKAIETGYTDTSSKIVHVTDGNISEWKQDKFETDKETNISFSIDHDKQNLYAALKITNPRIQMKLISQGMNFYIDKKGKKREGTGVEFPVKRQNEDGGGFGGGGRGGNRGSDNNESRQPDPKAFRERMAGMLIFLKTFGFDDQEDKQQLIAMENGVNIAVSWDDANTMYIEYLVPLSFLGNAAALNGKPLGIGWKINGMQAPDAGAGPGAGVGGGESRGGGGGSRGGGGGGRGGGSGAGSAGFAPSANYSSDDRSKEQSFWTKFMINF